MMLEHGITFRVMQACAAAFASGSRSDQVTPAEDYEALNPKSRRTR